MNTALLTAGLSNIAISLVSIALAIPLVNRQVKMNHWYGVRIRKAFVSPENWEKINEYGGRALIYWSIPIFLIGAGVIVAAFFIPNKDAKGLGLLLAVAPLSAVMLMGALIQIMVWSKKLPD